MSVYDSVCELLCCELLCCECVCVFVCISTLRMCERVWCTCVTVNYCEMYFNITMTSSVDGLD